MSVLEFNNFSVKLKNKEKTLIKDLSFKIDQGQSLGIVGESGSGKSLTALSSLGLLNKKVFTTSGEILINNKNIFELRDNELNSLRGNEISMIFQEPMLSLNPVRSLYSQIEECVELSDEKLDVSDIRATLEAVGLTDTEKILHSYPHMISGGQRQRFKNANMIAMSIIRKPNIKSADEPTTALDVTLQKQILDTLINLKKDMNMSMILISHDIELIRRYCDCIAVMRNGSIIENADTDKIFSNPQDSYTRELVNFKSTSFRNNIISNKHKILETKNLYCKYLTKDSFFKNKKEYYQALKNINLHIHEGESVGIVGESGSGKTTLAMSIMHLLSYDGEIKICGNITRENIYKERSLRKNFQISY